MTGCNRFTESKEAASDINEAVHSVRTTHLSYDEETFTLNDLFKSILRDTRWEYDAQAGKLQVKGTWLEPLSLDQQWEDTYKNNWLKLAK